MSKANTRLLSLETAIMKHSQSRSIKMREANEKLHSICNTLSILQSFITESSEVQKTSQLKES